MFDGTSPFTPRGCVADARAVAEILRVVKEEGLEL
jgi:glycogen debranching enzyme